MTSPGDWTRSKMLIGLLDEAASVLLDTPGRTGCRVDLPDCGRLLVSGDLHDNLPNFGRIVAEATLDVDDHHVLLQELIHGPSRIHGCDMSWRMLARAADLVLEFPGRVHPILGNHENSQLTRAGVSKGSGNSVELFEDGLAMTFGEDWEQVASAIDGFISAMPLAVRTASGVQCTHSIPDHAMMNQFDTSILDRDLDPGDRVTPVGDAYMLTWGRRFTDEQIDALLQAWNIKAVLIGHVHVDNGVRRLGPHHAAISTEDLFGAVMAIDLAAEVDLDTMLEKSRPVQMIPLPEAAP